jgi:hypothetical protein
MDRSTRSPSRDLRDHDGRNAQSVKFLLLRRTSSKRMRGTLKKIREALHRRRHLPWPCKGRIDPLAVWTASGEKLRCRYHFDGELLEVQVPAEGSYRFRVERPEPDLLELHGEDVVLRLRARDPDDFLLRSRGFHWVSEYPFNR